MVFVRETDTLLFAFSDRIITWKQENEKDSLEELKIPEPLLPENLTKGQIEVIKKEKRNITWIELSNNGEYIAATTENKQLVVFNKTFQLVKNILLTRVSSKVCFTPTNDILVADRTGDVYLYKMDDKDNKPTLLLGHLSVILDMIVTECAKYIITCDRDEKIRVSHYPNAYNIAAYCLGHTEFVTTIKLLKNKVLLSASGDGTVRMWNYLEGKQVNIIDTKSLVKEKVLEDFATQMDAEKVDVTSLPITDIQIHEDGENVMVVISLYNLDHLHFYKMNLNTLQYTHVTCIEHGTKLFSFHLSPLSNKFYIFCGNGSLMVFQFVKDLGISYLSGCFLEKDLEKYKELFVFDSDITLLYKRKFDNVQEYMERKKQRLESK